jgi:hypothetical protein
MTPEEQYLITRTFDRISAVPVVAKDMDAERLIRQQFDRMPDAPYRLVQSVLVQEQALESLSGRLRQLEDAAAADGLAGQARNNGASFLSAYRSPPATPAGSVPAVAAASSEQAGRSDDRAVPAPPRAGGFLASALSTATGVAGGMLLTDGLRELFGGRASSAIPERAAATDDLTTRDRLQDDAQDAQSDAEEARRQLADDDAALDEAQDSLESSGGDAGWDGGEA